MLIYYKEKMLSNYNVVLNKMEGIDEYLNKINYVSGKFTLEQQQQLSMEFGKTIPTVKGLVKAIQVREERLNKEFRKAIREADRLEKKELLKEARTKVKQAKVLAKQQLRIDEDKLLRSMGFLEANKRNISLKKFGIPNRKDAVEISNIRNTMKNTVLDKIIDGASLRLAYPRDKWLAQFTGDKMEPFSVEMESSIIAGLKKTFNFKNFKHFQDWVEKLDEKSGSGQAVKFQAVRDAFRLVRLKFTKAQGGASNRLATTKHIVGLKYDFTCYSPESRGNNCAFEAIRYMYNGMDVRGRNWVSQERKRLLLNPDEPLEPRHFINCWNNTLSKGRVVVITDDYTEHLSNSKSKYNFDDDNVVQYVLLHEGHYWVIKEAKDNDFTNMKVKRGELYYDLETRPDLSKGFRTDDSRAIIHPLKDTICAVYYRRNRKDTYTKVVFTTNRQESSAKQFINFLQAEASQHHFYNVVAHNGSNFDNYFLLQNMSPYQITQTNQQHRGTSVIAIQFCSHLIKDSCCFLINSLDNLCKSYKVQNPKLTEFVINGETLTNKNLCFYKPELDFWEFMELEKTNVEYWSEYVDYCIEDCVSLKQVWLRFTQEITNILTSMRLSPFVLGKCKVNSNITIGGLAKKLIEALNMKNRAKFKYDKFLDNDYEKYRYVNEFKRGGISHCNQAGKHNHEVVSYDLTSQYPSAMIHMRVPCGKSRWVKDYDSDTYGFYKIKNIKFGAISKNFKPIAYQGEVSLDWVHQWEEDDSLLIGSELLKYMIKTDGLSFDVIDGLVSDDYVMGENIFGTYVNGLFAEKAKQDVLKDAKDTDYNPALREVIKLLLNSVSGKLVEDPLKQAGFQISSPERSGLMMNGVPIEKPIEEGKINPWVVAGCCVYDFSKILLWSFVNNLPNGSDDVIHIETDSIYFSAEHEEQFKINVKDDRSRKHFPVKIGDGLGHIKKEHHSEGESYFLGKKNYYLCDKGEHVMKMKGIPNKTHDEYGNTVSLLSKDFYVKVYNDEVLYSDFATLNKQLYPTPLITSTRMVRRTRLLVEVSEYN